MERVIKFRVWNQGINRMYDVYGFTDRQIQWRNESGGLGGSFSYGKNNKMKFILLQFTGQLDKNGKEIYEGDIFKTHYGSIYSIEFIPKLSLYSICRPVGKVASYPFLEFDSGEVIGNIYENPELLTTT